MLSLPNIPICHAGVGVTAKLPGIFPLFLRISQGLRAKVMDSRIGDPRRLSSPLPCVSRCRIVHLLPLPVADEVLRIGRAR